jgi:uncharacterized membrane protein required for colicin V production
MVLDGLMAAVITVWAVFGYRRGFVRQIFTLAGILLVIFVSAPMAEMLENILTKEFDMYFDGRYMRSILLSVSGAVLYLLSYVVGRFLHETLVKGISVAEKTNHILGMVLAVVQALLVIYFVLCIGSIYQTKIQEYAPVIYQAMNDSKGYQVADNNNLLENYTFFQRDIEKKASEEPQNPEKNEKSIDASEQDKTASPQPETSRVRTRTLVRKAAE